MAKHNKIEKRFKCTVCGKAFPRNDNRRRHERLHGQDPNNAPVRRAMLKAANEADTATATATAAAATTSTVGRGGGAKRMRGRMLRGAGAGVPSTRSRRATTAAATARQRMKVSKMSSAFRGANISWRLEFPQCKCSELAESVDF